MGTNDKKDAKLDKQDEKITYLSSKFSTYGYCLEKMSTNKTQLHPLKLQIKENLEAQSSMKLSYNECLKKIINNNKITLKFYTPRKYTEEIFSKRFEEFKAEETISIDIKSSALNSKNIPIFITNIHMI